MSYFLKLFNTGAIRPTPIKVINAITKEVSVQPVINIIELGAGKGEITSEILLKENNSSVNYIAFEFDKEQAAGLKNKFPGVSCVSEDAFEFRHYLPKDFKADYFICALPLSFYPKVKTAKLFDDAKSVLKPGGKIIILFTAFWLIPFLKKQFPSSRLESFATIPPYFVLTNR